MLSYEEINKILKNRLSSDRYAHTLGVVDSAIELAKKFDGDIEKVKLSALLHDCGKTIEKDQQIKMATEYKIYIDQIYKMQPSLLHGPIGRKIAEIDFKVEDREILDSIEYHTTGRVNMSKLEKIIYLADYIEEGRDFPQLETIRKAAKQSLDKGLLLALNNSIEFIIKKHKLLHPLTIEARNDILNKIYYNREKL